MTTPQLRRFHAMSPFHPFDIYLANGRVVRVSHPEFLILGERTFAVYHPDNTVEVIDLLLVVSLRLAAHTSDTALSRN